MIAVNKHCLEIASKAQDISASGGLVATWEGTMLNSESSSSQLTPDVHAHIVTEDLRVPEVYSTRILPIVFNNSTPPREL